MKYIFPALLLTAFILSLQPASAEILGRKESAAVKQPECPMIDTSTISVTFSSSETDITKVKGLLAVKIAEIENFAKDKGIDKLNVQNSSYSISSSNGSNCDAKAAQYQFYGNASFTVEPASRAEELMLGLIEKGINSSINVNSYRQCQ